MTCDRGRPFTIQDEVSNIIVNRALAEREWPGEDPVGRSLHLGQFEATIIGVVQDVRHDGLASEPRTALYVLDLGFPRSLMNVYVKIQGDPAVMAPAIRDAVWSVNPDQTMTEILPMARLVELEAARPRFLTMLLGGFAALALGLAGLGLYGVISFMVSRRLAELGIRIALGARGREVLKEVISDGLRITGLGLPNRSRGCVLAQPAHDHSALWCRGKRSGHVRDGRRDGGVDLTSGDRGTGGSSAPNRSGPGSEDGVDEFLAGGFQVFIEGDPVFPEVLCTVHGAVCRADESRFHFLQFFPLLFF